MKMPVEEGTPKLRCWECKREQFVRKNQLTPRIDRGKRTLIFMCKYCGSSREVDDNQIDLERWM